MVKLFLNLRDKSVNANKLLPINSLQTVRELAQSSKINHGKCAIPYQSCVINGFS